MEIKQQTTKDQQMNEFQKKQKLISQERKLKHHMPEFTECREISAQREIFIYKHTHLKEVISNMNNVNFHLHKIKKEE